MSTNRPDKNELIETVREFLEEKVLPLLDGTTAFHTRVAINVLKIVERELEHGPLLEKKEHDGLHRLLKIEGDVKELNEELCKQLRDGRMDFRNDALIAHMRQTTLDNLSIDNPRYSAYIRTINEARE